MVRPPDVPTFVIRLVNSRRGWSSAFSAPHMPWHVGRGFYNVAYPSPPKITVRVQLCYANERIVWHREAKSQRRGYLPLITNGADETLLYIIAHEMRHLWQWTQSPRATLTAEDHITEFREGIRYRETKPERVADEGDACNYAIAMLEQYRRCLPRAA